MARAGLRAMLETDDLRVIGEGASLTEPGLPAGVDVVVVSDEALLGERALQALGHSEVGLVLLSESERSAALLRALPVRGWAIVSPEAPAGELHAAAQAAAQGLVTLSL